MREPSFATRRVTAERGTRPGRSSPPSSLNSAPNGRRRTSDQPGRKRIFEAISAASGDTRARRNERSHQSWMTRLQLSRVLRSAGRIDCCQRPSRPASSAISNRATHWSLNGRGHRGAARARGGEACCVRQGGLGRGGIFARRCQRREQDEPRSVRGALRQAHLADGRRRSGALGDTRGQRRGLFEALVNSRRRGPGTAALLRPISSLVERDELGVVNLEVRTSRDSPSRLSASSVSSDLLWR